MVYTNTPSSIAMIFSSITVPQYCRFFAGITAFMHLAARQYNTGQVRDCRCVAWLLKFFDRFHFSLLDQTQTSRGIPLPWIAKCSKVAIVDSIDSCCFSAILYVLVTLHLRIALCSLISDFILTFSFFYWFSFISRCSFLRLSHLTLFVVNLWNSHECANK